MEGLAHLDYPTCEVIVVNDGSTDATPQIASEYPVKLITTENRGLSSARNTGWQEASGEIVAYIDDDAYPDPHWLRYLAYTFMTTDFVGVGGPNIAPPGDGPIADCIANAPGGPVHVLLSDVEAEHIPGCNMAFRRAALEAIGGFDPRYRAAGDDVDLCWRFQERGWKIGFHPGAVDWHHRRNSFTMYWRQQKGYGKAEALLEEKWPQRYNAVGHLTWGGRIYGKGLTLALQLQRQHIYGGVWGTAAYQSLYEPAPFTLLALTLMPEWYLVIIGLAGLSLLGLSWQPLLGAVPFLALAVTAPVIHAIVSATKAVFPTPAPHRERRVAQYAITAVLHLLQPLARLIGRLRHGLTPWRRRRPSGFMLPRQGTVTIWSESWQGHEEWVMSIEQSLRRISAIFRRGGDYDDWDLEVRGGMFGSARMLTAVEEHGAGRQFVRFRLWPRVSRGGLALMLFFASLSSFATADHAWVTALLLGVVTLAVTARAVLECGWAVGSLHRVLEEKGGNAR
jgi:GT2 family glycosyltransferase/membrane protein implicated in regulation of membrane protease activity